MNVIKINNILYKYEFFWRKNKKEHVYDFNNKLLPFPEHNDTEFPDKSNIHQTLLEVQRNLYADNKFYPYSSNNYKDCLLCDKKDITTGIYSVNNVRWETGLKHYIKKHNIKPSDEFIDFIYRYSNNIRPSKNIIARINGIKVVRSNKKYLKITRNQILIMDALMEHGGFKVYGDRKNQLYRYSEHAGLLDFNNSGLEKIIISGNTTRVDANDDDIYLPRNMIEALDYEYIFHTHPPTPVPGGRVKSGILYEFPSISDIFHFIDHYNGGRTQGSIVIAPEGMYIIRKKKVDDTKIDIDEDEFYKETLNMMWKCQRESITKYGKTFTTKKFYSKIAQDKTYINNINKVINKYKLHIDYYPRIKDETNKWVIDTIYLPVYVTELK
ncbi:hypothetical protein QKU48_gp0421 [Fadolivirus algeromassiliense]|jgi:hypothetical protein|uniref:Uncharacterized protein n=1 Tax=Fadolivirus FV1/VV64 TaxID=3070911 RepID=A0A7D3QVS7_9VIRU|nr:hypothetical protein QKU48_gp0421 [Fadolivirus algeromassiliense]QKF93879.1 hypothetical protein Fadolivirus_1_421 [Fadolivirus FV1/VV64]